MVYFCKDCNAYVGCHCNSRKALGTMANATLRWWRRQAHDSIDPLWLNSENRRGTRNKIYEKLSAHFKRDIHVGESDIDTCKEIIKFVNEYKKRMKKSLSQAKTTGVKKNY